MTTERASDLSVDFQAVNTACLRSFTSLLAIWVPGGVQRGNEWVARNPHRADRRAGSFSINIRSGKWADFATGDRGGDPVSLYAFLKGLSQSQAALELRTDWGMGR